MNTASINIHDIHEEYGEMIEDINRLRSSQAALKIFTFGYGHSSPNRYILLPDRATMVQLFEDKWAFENEWREDHEEHYAQYQMREVDIAQAIINWKLWKQNNKRRLEDIQNLNDYECLLGKDTRPMMDAEGKCYMHLIIFEGTAPDEEKEAVWRDVTAEEWSSVNIMRKRFEAAEIPYNKLLTIFLSQLCDSPGKAVMWAYSINRWQSQHKKVMTLSDFGEAFPWGVPADQDYTAAWDQQKHPDAPLGNLLDDFGMWDLSYFDELQEGE